MINMNMQNAVESSFTSFGSLMFDTDIEDNVANRGPKLIKNNQSKFFNRNSNANKNRAFMTIE